MRFLFQQQAVCRAQWQTQGPRAGSGPPPCFYLAAAPSSRLTVKEQLHLYSPKITLHPWKADVAPGENELDTPAVEKR